VTCGAVRLARAEEIPALAQLWRDAWMDAHAAHVPAELTALRDVHSFADRLETLRPDVRVVGPVGAPLGLCAIRADEMYQLFVVPEGRGTGVAARLLSDAEARLSQAGVRTGTLQVIEANHRARHFYARQGWRDRGVEEVALDTAEGPFTIRAMIMVKPLSPRAT